MNYHNITKKDMLNGDGLRVVLWVAGCEHHCKNCQNPITWNEKNGLNFTDAEKQEIFDELKEDYTSGITFSGGDPMHPNNIETILSLAKEIKEKYPSKTIWIYTGYVYEELLNNVGKDFDLRRDLLKYTDILVDGRFEQNLKDVNLHWKGSRNQRVIEVQNSSLDYIKLHTQQ